MKNILLAITVFIALASCTENSSKKALIVNDIAELNTAIAKASPGDKILLADGIWKDAAIKFYGNSTEKQPITISAETPGKVFLEGNSFIQLGGEYLTVSNLYFRNGYSPNSSIIRFMINEDSVANNCRVTNTVIKDYNQPNRYTNDRWIELYGKHNQFDHNYISGKSNDGETLRVFFAGNQHIENHHQIVNNYFGPRPRKGGPRGETIRIGDSKTRFSPGYVNVSDNFFNACNGEVEIISDKTNFNSFNHNIFYKSEGSLVLRHSNYAKVNGNIFIGGDDSEFYGGIRVVNAGHWITNNYFYNIKGEEFRSPLAIMNGIPMTPLNRYLQVSDVVVAFNTWVDCTSPWQIGIGQNLESASVLPASEIRSAAPIRSIVANNLIYNSKADRTPVINHSEMDGILFKNNIIDNNGTVYSEYDVLQNGEVKMEQINEWLFAPANFKDSISKVVYYGFDFSKINKDIFGASRSYKNSPGAINDLSLAKKFIIDKKKYGPDWFSPEEEVYEPQIIKATAAEGELAAKIQQAHTGDIIELTDAIYQINTPLAIDKSITLRSKDATTKAELIFTNDKDSVAFKMKPKGKLRLEHIIVKGLNNQIAFAPLTTNMSSAYSLDIVGCEISNFAFILKAYKGSFANSISLKDTAFNNCLNGIVLAADEKGDYNAEMVSIYQCEFDNIGQNVIDFYRGGYDESTIGGYLTIKNSSFTNCGKNEKSDILLKTKGIINVLIADNTFKNNPVSYAALLWGEKNNHHTNNTTINSGEIKVEEQQKLKILY
ncbi:chondroitinase-B domain-containing protein [Maribacter sp. 1_MG-2023]|uniref:chondroitinase-B domain-containing protein n=1 Tax=Maribacter sp. 1_MG-2023 TaxID=3062677 RepID=UPI0026E30D9B|nr:chondroitinase-B domain-containing protein [Maribacter sp. 1_MG-2023]MDO6473386.1 chondroitinase-B domain-containing protein [Maribacter sp. 1_MG-2023]